MAKSERELEQQQQNVGKTGDQLKVFIADVLPRGCTTRVEIDDRMIELEELVKTYGGVVIVKHIQKRGTPDYNTYIGSGRLEEIVAEMELTGANVLIFWNALKAHQIYEVDTHLRKIGAKAWDRIDLILKIFERHAKTIESRLQIELASIHHMGPRIFGMGMELSSQWSGGSKLSRGKWETNTEIMKRHLQKREEHIKKELEKFKKVRAEHRKHRERVWYFTVWIVGYTNAWKSSLLNSLTKKGVLAEDKLFATLGTSVGKLFIPIEEITIDSLDRFRHLSSGGIELLLNDTIGFIRDLPPNLIEAFSSTLEDSIESDILLHIVDVNDRKLDEKIQIVDDILASIGANQKKIYVFNKADMLDEAKREELLKKYADIYPFFVSAYTKEGFDALKNKILQEL